MEKRVIGLTNENERLQSALGSKNRELETLNTRLYSVEYAETKVRELEGALRLKADEIERLRS